jgi:lipoic acid synthetase
LPLDENESERMIRAVRYLKFKHVVITSVSRDDLPDGGASYYAKVIRMLKEQVPSVTVEVLIPDFQYMPNTLRQVVEAKPEVISHNLETVISLYPLLRPESDFNKSLELLEKVKKIDDSLYTKSGFLVGLGESEDEVIELMKALREARCDIVTIGQYLQPSAAQFRISEFVSPAQFKKYREIGYQLGFRVVVSGPLVRSSYQAQETLERVKKVTDFNSLIFS